VHSSRTIATGYAPRTRSARRAFGLAEPVGGEKTFDFKALGVYCQRILSPKSERESPWGRPFRSSVTGLKRQAASALISAAGTSKVIPSGANSGTPPAFCFFRALW